MEGLFLSLLKTFRNQMKVQVFHFLGLAAVNNQPVAAILQVEVLDQLADKP